MRTPHRLLLLVGAVLCASAVAQPVAADGYLGLQLKRSDFRLGSNIALVGSARVAPAVGVHGRVGTTVMHSPTSLMGASEHSGAGLSYGVGLSWDFSPRASATFGLEIYDLRFIGGERDSVRSTNLGLQWRY